MNPFAILRIETVVTGVMFLRLREFSALADDPGLGSIIYGAVHNHV